MTPKQKDRKKGKLVEITIPQLIAVMEAADMLSAMVGTGSDFDAEAKGIVRKIDNFLKKNGYKRNYS